MKAKSKNAVISIFLDTRRAKNGDLYPVKLRIYHKSTKRAKLYPTIFDLTIAEFQSIWETTKPRRGHQEIRNELNGIEAKARDAASQLKNFSFEHFEKLLYGKAGASEDVFFQYTTTIKKLKDNNQIGTASSYELSLRSIKNFITSSKGKEPEILPFYDISPGWLVKYENYMINTMQLSRTTVGIYLRPLRAIFNTAIRDKEIEPEIYPFGKYKYQIPSVKRVKKALTKEQLSQLYHCTPQTPEQEKARDFFFFSYACNGMNIKDIALLRYKDIQDDKIVYYRAKTINTARTLIPIVVYLTEPARKVIEKYGNPDHAPSQLVFSILQDSMSEFTKWDKIKKFTGFINQHLKKLARTEGITDAISTYWARHSFATTAIRSGASMEFVSEALNHSNMKTTQGYFAGFEEADKRALTEALMKL